LVAIFADRFRFKGRFPENTFLGFKEAVQAGATIIETGEKKSKQKKKRKLTTLKLNI
jgi:hypothetical protein